MKREHTYEDKGGFIHIVFKRKSYKVIDEPQNEPQNTPLEKLSDRQRKIINAIKSNPNITKKGNSNGIFHLRVNSSQRNKKHKRTYNNQLERLQQRRSLGI